MPSRSKSPLAPLTVYVVFHPKSDECRYLAEQLHDWLRLKADDGDSTEAGLPIWFRSRLTLSAPDGEYAVSPAIEWNGARLNAVVVLVDDFLVADAHWTRALQRLIDSTSSQQAMPTGRVRFFPVPVDSSAFRLNELFWKGNRLYAGPPGPSSKTGKPIDRQAEATRLRARARILRRGLTEALTRELREPQDRDNAPKPLEVFLSHAKGDGRDIARALRDGFADFGQLKTWFDENDLAPGYDWQLPMEQAAHTQTAALLSVVTDTYSSRNWCRREVNLARTPRRVAGISREDVSAWTVQPTVAVSNGRELWSRPMAQLAQVPHVGWPSERSHIASRIEDVVDRLLLETLLVCHHRQLALAVADGLQLEDVHVALLTWVPDPWSLAHVRSELIAARTKGSPDRWILAYPGHGLRACELHELTELLTAMEIGDAAPDSPRFQLLPQELLGQVGLDAPNPRRIALSAGGRTQDVEEAGVGMVHVDDVLIRLSRRLLGQGHSLHYGGSLSQYDSNLTTSLIEVAQGWEARNAAPRGARASTGNAAPEGKRGSPLTNYASYPFYEFITVRQRAELRGICDFVEVDAPEPREQVASIDGSTSTFVQRSLDGAHALSRMRELMTSRAQVRVMLGGRRYGWSGWLPGIVEEFVSSASAFLMGEKHIPIVLGGFGGAASWIAGYLADQDAPWPEELIYDHAAKRNPKLVEIVNVTNEATARQRF